MRALELIRGTLPRDRVETSKGASPMKAQTTSRTEIGPRKPQWGDGQDRSRVRGVRRFADRRSSMNPLSLWLVVLTTVGCLLPAASAQTAQGQGDGGAKIDPRPVICLEVPHPEVLIDRLTEPRMQQYLGMLPQYRKLLEGDQFRQLKAVVNLVASQVGTTWDKGLRELTSGGIVAVVESGPGQQPCVNLLITPKDVPLLERTHQVLLKLAREDAQNKSKPDPVRTSEHKGVVVYTVGGETGPAYAIISGTLAISNSPKNLMRLIDRAPRVATGGRPRRRREVRAGPLPVHRSAGVESGAPATGGGRPGVGIRRSRQVEEA